MKHDNPQIMSASTMIGNKVENAAGENLGEVKELMIDRDTGDVAYAVLSFGGFLGLGDKLFAIPWRALELDTERHSFRLGVDKDRLKDAPGFDKDDWPRNPDRTFVDQIHKYYDIQPYYAAR